MAHTIDEALNNPLISLVKRNDARGMYWFRLGELEPIITIRLGRWPSGGRRNVHENAIACREF